MKKYIPLLLVSFMILGGCIKSPDIKRCLYTVTSADSTAGGDILIEIGRRFNQTLKVTSKTGTTTFFTIANDESVYGWNDKDPKVGYTFKLSPNKKNSDVSHKFMNGSGTMTESGKKLDYNCQPVTASDKDFVPPKGIEFRDYDKK